jgi:hypothetical protein
MKILVKKIIRDYVYHLETLNDFKKISGEAESLFRSELKMIDESALEALNPSDNGKPKSADKIEKVSFEDKDFKKLFRKIVVKCHPDKIKNNNEESEFLKTAYEEANQANDIYDWGLLLKVALDLRIELFELDDAKIHNINENILNLKEQIQKYEQSMAYQWYIKPEENREAYLKDCAAIFKMSLNKPRPS